MTRRIFMANLKKKMDEFEREHGVKPHERGKNIEIEEEKERLAKEALLKEQQKR